MTTGVLGPSSTVICSETSFQSLEALPAPAGKAASDVFAHNEGLFLFEIWQQERLCFKLHSRARMRLCLQKKHDLLSRQVSRKKCKSILLHPG